jgi:ABC-type lipoprotein export system ATPase subunit
MGETSVDVKGSYSWGFVQKEDVEIDECLTLKDMNFNIKKGEFVCVIGAVGCGKSSLLNAISSNMIYMPEDSIKVKKGKQTKEQLATYARELSQLDISEAPVKVCGKVAFAEQKAWIENKTIKETILFGKELDEERYQMCIKACQLTEDFEKLKGGDGTELGENGINLSGGQKARVTLARTVYQDADVILLDDPVSALDATVGKAVFDEVIRGVCKEKTTILATHAVDFFELADKIIVMDKGEQKGFGHLNDLKTNPIMAEILAEHNKQRQKTLEAAKMKSRQSIDMTTLQKAVTMMQFERRSKSTMQHDEKRGNTNLGKSRSEMQPITEKLQFKKPKATVDDQLLLDRRSSTSKSLTKEIPVGSPFEAETNDITAPEKGDDADAAKLVEKDAAEDDDIKEVNRSTYDKILNETGGLQFWVAYLSLVIVRLFVWDESGAFWPNFVDKPIEE